MYKRNLGFVVNEILNLDPHPRRAALIALKKSTGSPKIPMNVSVQPVKLDFTRPNGFKSLESLSCDTWKKRLN